MKKETKKPKTSGRRSTKESAPATKKPGLSSGASVTEGAGANKARSEQILPLVTRAIKTDTFKLGPIENQPPMGSPFNILKERRMPGWHPDGNSIVDGKVFRYFQEEALGRTANGNIIPFDVPFQEPASNRWILGGPIPDNNPANPFTQIIRTLAEYVRCYNASLYRLRRLHFWVYIANYQRDYKPMPRANPTDGLPDPLPFPGKELNDLISDAENNWIDVTNEISNFLDTEHDGLSILAADMVEVNGYIASMRVIADTVEQQKQHGDKIVMEVGGSSSSHVSISSAFSSSSSANPMFALTKKG